MKCVFYENRSDNRGEEGQRQAGGVGIAGTRARNTRVIVIVLAAITQFHGMRGTAFRVIEPCRLFERHRSARIPVGLFFGITRP